MSTEYTGPASIPSPGDVPVAATPRDRMPEQIDQAPVDVKAKVVEVKAKVQESAEQARQAIQDPQNAGKVRGGGAVAAGATALAVLVWAVRRRRNRPQTRWEKTADVTRQAWDRATDLAVEYGEAARTNDQVEQAVKTSRRAAKKAVKQARQQGRNVAAATPEATPRRLGGVASVLVAVAAAAVAYQVSRRSSASTS
ncbi:MAG: hypothetical protein ABIS86_11200 [Streptosporangiaceae bacterium]